MAWWRGARQHGMLTGDLGLTWRIRGATCGARRVLAMHWRVSRTRRHVLACGRSNRRLRLHLVTIPPVNSRLVVQESKHGAGCSKWNSEAAIIEFKSCGGARTEMSEIPSARGFDLPLEGGGFPNGGSKGGVLSLVIHGGAWRTWTKWPSVSLVRGGVCHLRWRFFHRRRIDWRKIYPLVVVFVWNDAWNSMFRGWHG